MLHIAKKLAYFLIGRIIVIKNDHVKILHNTRVKWSSKFEGYNVVCDNSYFRGELGLCSYIGPDSIIVGKIGRFCSIARNVIFLESTHPTATFVSTHPAFYSTGDQCGIHFVKNQKFIEKPLLAGSDYPIEVGNDVYIGAGATIVGPVRIGTGAIVAANATVVHDVEPYSIVGGTPARIIKKRFSDDTVHYLLKSKWWENDLKWYIEHGESFESVEALKKDLGGNDEE